MADIALVAARISMVFPLKASVQSYIADATITKGQAVYIKTTGKVGLADANGSGTLQFRGIALGNAVAGQAIDVCEEGHMAGFTVSSLDADTLVYLSNTAGALADAAGSTAVAVGRIVCLTDQPTLTKVVRVFTRLEADWA